jgi:hypothetical protein
MDTDAGRQRSTLRRIARRAMIERGLQPDFSYAALAGNLRIQDRVAQKLKAIRHERGAGAHRLQEGRLR